MKIRDTLFEVFAGAGFARRKDQDEDKLLPVRRERLLIHLSPTLVDLSAWNVLQVVIISYQHVSATSLNKGCKKIYYVYLYFCFVLCFTIAVFSQPSNINSTPVS